MDCIGDDYIRVMTPMWNAQARALKEFCEGLSNQICKRRDCMRGFRGCNRAHDESECISGLVDATEKVEDKLFDQLEEHAGKFRILTKLFYRYKKN